MDPSKKVETERVFSAFSQQVGHEIRKKRQLGGQIDLNNVFTAK
jgi:hypothetical protein